MIEAAKILGCSAIELANHENRNEWMTAAFTYRSGKDQGEYMRETYRPYQDKLKEMSAAIRAARGD